jgi:molybdopterin-guanine dinucleotide biosynthesis protein A
MLHRVLAAASGATCRIVVGPARTDVPADVIQVREDPPGGGPVAALAAGLAELGQPGLPNELDRPGQGGDLVALLAADLPFLVVADIEALRDAVGALGEPIGAVGGAAEADGAVLVDSAGRPQWLCGVYRVSVLRRRLADLGPPAGQSVRRLVAGLRIATVARATTPPPWYDCDTEDDYRRAEELA